MLSLLMWLIASAIILVLLAGLLTYFILTRIVKNGFPFHDAL